MHAQTPTCAAPGCNSVASDNGKDTAVGTGALTHLTGGNPGAFFYDTAVGFQALYSNTSDGSYNSAFGSLALYSNTSGSENTGLGLQALYSNTTGGGNTASGANALLNNTTGTSNTASGALRADNEHDRYRQHRLGGPIALLKQGRQRKHRGWG